MYHITQFYLKVLATTLGVLNYVLCVSSQDLLKKTKNEKQIQTEAMPENRVLVLFAAGKINSNENRNGLTPKQKASQS